MREGIKGKTVLARRGKEMVGEYFQEYYISHEEAEEDGYYIHERGLNTTYTEFEKAHVFKSLEDAIEELKRIYEKGSTGWYPLDYDRWNEGRG